MSAYQQLRYDVADGVTTITLHRPERLNAFTNRMVHELVDAFDRVDGDDDVRAAVVTGAGRAFCAGADLGAGGGAFADHGRSTDGAPVRDGGGIVALRIFDCLKPVIAAINGPAAGVGITMTLPMDVRLVSTAVDKVGFVFVRRGITPEATSSWFLPRVVGISQAMEWVATGRVFGHEEGLRAGLFRSAHAPGELLPAAHALAREMAEGTSPVSVALSRRLLWRMLGAAHPMEAHRAESRAMAARGPSPDAAEGVTAFLEKRPPRFSMRVSSDLPDVFADEDQPERA